MNPRLAATKALLPVLQGKASLSSSLTPQLIHVDEKDKSLTKELVLGTARWLPKLHLILDQLLEKPIKKADKDIETLLYIGLYQLYYTRIPAHAAINETVDCATILKKNWAKALINAVLRRAQREQTILSQQLDKDPVFHTAHPRWLQKRLKADWPQEWQTICEANNHHPPMTLRINNRHTTQTDYLNHLIQANIPANTGHLSKQAIILDTPQVVQTLPFFEKGWVSVQDEAAQLAAYLLDLHPQQRVLDLCCAPGGKTCHILELQPNLKEVVAVDLEANRLKRVEENLQRLQLSATVITADGNAIQQWWDNEPFQRILLDAPCSATGVIRRHPDIKLTRQETDITPLAELQYQLLNTAWQMLDIGGILLYATCSVLPEENTQNIQHFLENTPNAQEIPMNIPTGIPQSHGCQLLPQINGHDGFYYAKLMKIEA